MKKIIKLCKLSLLLVAGLLILTGCGKVKTEKLTQKEYSYTLSVDVPAEKGYKFIEKLEEKNEFAMDYPDFILDGEKVQIFFDDKIFVYQTSIELGKKYPEMDKDNPNFDDFIKYSEFDKDSIIDINGRKAVKKKYEYGPANNTELKGYTYFIEKGDISGYYYVMVLPKNDGDDIKALMEDEEVKVIIDSLTFTKNK